MATLAMVVAVTLGAQAPHRSRRAEAASAPTLIRMPTPGSGETQFPLASPGRTAARNRPPGGPPIKARSIPLSGSTARLTRGGIEKSGSGEVKLLTEGKSPRTCFRRPNRQLLRHGECRIDFTWMEMQHGQTDWRRCADVADLSHARRPGVRVRTPMSEIQHALDARACGLVPTWTEAEAIERATGPTSRRWPAQQWRRQASMRRCGAGAGGYRNTANDNIV